MSYQNTYNHHIPQRALNHLSPIEALKDWREKSPELFVKWVYKQAELDIQWAEVCSRLSSTQHAMLETLLVVDPKTQKSPFANLCAAPGRPSRKNLNALVDRYQWLQGLPNSATALQSIADSKISQWANEAQRLNALELREYVTLRRHTLLMAVIHDARGQVLDGLTQMLLRLARKVEW